MKSFFIVHGLKRSGNHAIINWITEHDPFIFSNNIIPTGPILRGENKIPPPKEFNFYLFKNFSPQKRKVRFWLKKFKYHNYSFLASIEDHDLNIRPFSDAPTDSINILILRDPRNLFASRIRKASAMDSPSFSQEMDETMNHIIDLWKNHTKEYLGLTNYLNNKVCIYFNLWFSSQEYRKSISRKLNLEFTDKGFTQVSEIGGGSSFDGTKFHGNNQKMDVLNRQDYLSEAEKKILETIFLDEELQELINKIESLHER